MGQTSSFCERRSRTAYPPRELDLRFCLVDEKGNPKAFSSITQSSGENDEKMMRSVFGGSGSRDLLAEERQETQEQYRLLKCRDETATLLEKTVSRSAGDGMRKKGSGKEMAEIDTVFEGSFETFEDRFGKLGRFIVKAMGQVNTVLVEICSDSRFVPMKLYQLEIQSCLVARRGYLVDKAPPWKRTPLDSKTTGFAMILNRAALRICVPQLAEDLGLANVLRACWSRRSCTSSTFNQRLHCLQF